MYDPLFDRARNIAFVARPSREGIPRQRSVRTGFSADTEVSPYIHYNYGTKELQMSLACVPKLDGVASAYLLLKYTSHRCHNTTHQAHALKEVHSQDEQPFLHPI